MVSDPCPYLLSFSPFLEPLDYHFGANLPLDLTLTNVPSTYLSFLTNEPGTWMDGEPVSLPALPLLGSQLGMEVGPLLVLLIHAPSASSISSVRFWKTSFLLSSLSLAERTFWVFQ